MSYETLGAIFKHIMHPVYQRMNSQVNQNAIRKTVKAWKSYFKLCQDYAVSPKTYTARPNIPGCKRATRITAWFTNQTNVYMVRDGMAYLRFVNCSSLRRCRNTYRTSSALTLGTSATRTLCPSRSAGLRRSCGTRRRSAAPRSWCVRSAIPQRQESIRLSTQTEGFGAVCF